MMPEIGNGLLCPALGIESDGSQSPSPGECL